MVRKLVFVALVVGLGLVADVAQARGRRSGGCPGGNCSVSGSATAATQTLAKDQIAAQEPPKPAAPATIPEAGAKPATETVAGNYSAPRRFLRRR